MKHLNLICLLGFLISCGSVFADSKEISERARSCGVSNFNENKLSFAAISAITFANGEELHKNVYAVTFKSLSTPITPKQVGMINVSHIAGDIYTARGTLCGVLKASGSRSITSNT